MGYIIFMSILLVIEIIAWIWQFKASKNIYNKFMNAYNDENTVIKFKGNLEKDFKIGSIIYLVKIIGGIIGLLLGLYCMNSNIIFITIVLSLSFVSMFLNNKVYVFSNDRLFECFKGKDIAYDDIKCITIIKKNKIKVLKYIALKIIPSDLNKNPIIINIGIDKIDDVIKFLNSKNIKTEEITNLIETYSKMDLA